MKQLWNISVIKENKREFMKKIVIIIASVLLFGCSNKSTNEKYDGYSKKDNLEKPETVVDRMSYTFGYDITEGVKMMDSANSDINFDYLIAGIIDGLENADPLLDEEERFKLVTEIQKIQTEAEKIRYNNRMAELEKIGEDFAESGPDFLAENIKKEGWKETKTGLQYKPIKTNREIDQRGLRRLKTAAGG